MGSYDSENDGKALVNWLNKQCGTRFSFVQIKTAAGVNTFDSENDARTLHDTMCEFLPGDITAPVPGKQPCVWRRVCGMCAVCVCVLWVCVLYMM